MNAWKWKVANAPGVLQHDEVVDSLERAVKKHPRTLFIACHLANCCSDPALPIAQPRRARSDALSS